MTGGSNSVPDLLSGLSLRFESAIIRSDRVLASDILDSAANISSLSGILDGIIAPALQRIGTRWEAGELALAQVFMAGKIAETLIGEKMTAEGFSPVHPTPRIAVAVYEDFHSLGKQMIITVLRAAGYDPIDYGINLNGADLVRLIEKDEVDILFLSALMLRAALSIKDFTRLIAERGLKTRIIVGGAPFIFDPGLADEVGAWAMAKDAAGTIPIIERYLKEDI